MPNYVFSGANHGVSHQKFGFLFALVLFGLTGCPKDMPYTYHYDVKNLTNEAVTIEVRFNDPKEVSASTVCRSLMN